MRINNKPVIVDLHELPVWRGAQETPTFRCASFSLTFEEATGLVRLLSPEIEAHTVAGYGKKGYRFPTSPPGSSAWGNALAEKSLQGLVETVSDLDGLDVMEIGGGTLYCARQMLERMGARTVTLVDPSTKDIPDDARLQVRREYFTDDTAVERRPSFIVSFNTLEHVPDPEGFLRAARRHLSDNGRLFIKVPDCGRSLRSGDLGICAHEHLTYFTNTSLDRLLRATGFKRIGDANYQGALQILAVKAPSVRTAPEPEPLSGFKRAADAHVERIRAFAETHRGGRAAFIGASVGLSNLLYVTRPNENLDIDIYDSDELKTGKFLPGAQVPIQSTMDWRLETHDTVFVTPMNFFEEIRAGLMRRPGLAGARILNVFGDEGWGED